jgi:hypothetical protein
MIWINTNVRPASQAKGFLTAGFSVPSRRTACRIAPTPGSSRMIIHSRIRDVRVSSEFNSQKGMR